LEDGRIRTILSPVGTETGRLNSSGRDKKKWPKWEYTTNLQNINKKVAKLDPLYDVRSYIVPSPGYVFLEMDLSQAEARVVSGYAADHKTLEIFLSGADIHKITAASIFGVEAEEVSTTQRMLGKKARHALNYGMGWKKFLEDVNKDADTTGVGITAREAEAITEAYRHANAPLVRWWREIEDQVRSRGYLINAYGRKRIFLTRPDDASINDAIAYLPQSTIADHLNHIFVDIFDDLDPEIVRVVHQIHDAVLMEAPVESWVDAAKKVKALSERSVMVNGIEVPLPCDLSVGYKSWGAMLEVEF